MIPSERDLLQKPINQKNDLLAAGYEGSLMDQSKLRFRRHVSVAVRVFQTAKFFFGMRLFKCCASSVPYQPDDAPRTTGGKAGGPIDLL
ncbi:MAG: hypothetical protein ACK5X9_07960 [Alphaproteobacteria bacterium]|jgi:hypothetical protein